MAVARIALIAAVAANGVIGRDNTLPWHLPEDLRRFRQITFGKPLVMGRRTHQAIGRALPGRTNIVITADRSWYPPGVVVAHSITAALAIARAEGVDEIMVIGGERVYRQTLAIADRLYLTRIDAVVAGDAFFPAIDAAQWTEVAHQRGEAPAGGLRYDFVILDRRTD